MQISPVTSGATSVMPANDRFAKIKQSFDDLGSALESGNLSDAKTALTELQKNAPKQAVKESNPMSEKMEALSKAIESGDLKAAQTAYADIKETMSQRPQGTPPSGGTPPSRAGKSVGASGAGESASAESASSKYYDKMDADKDGAVTWKEEQDYLQKHPEDVSNQSTTGKIDSDRGLIDALA
jgi:hypothetical protein